MEKRERDRQVKQTSEMLTCNEKDHLFSCLSVVLFLLKRKASRELDARGQPWLFRADAAGA